MFILLSLIHGGLESDTDASLYDWVHDRDILSGSLEKVDIRFFDMAHIEKKYQI